MSIFAVACLYKIIRLLKFRNARYYIEKTVKSENRDKFIKVEVSCYLCWIILFMLGDGYGYFFIVGHSIDWIDGLFLALLAAGIVAVQFFRFKVERKMYY